MKRFSTVFRRDKKSDQKDLNGATAENGNLNGRIGRRSTGTGKKLGGGDSSDGPDHSVNRDGIVATLEKFSQVIQAAGRPLPTATGDGSYIDNPKKDGLFGDLAAMNIENYETAIALLKQHLSGQELTDDRTMIMEKTIRVCEPFQFCFEQCLGMLIIMLQLVANLPPNSANRVKLTNTFVGTLWDSLGHPPQSQLGDKYNYRQPDGS